MRLIETPYFKMGVLRPKRTVTSHLIAYYLGAALPRWCPEVTVVSLAQTSGPERFEGGCSTPSGFDLCNHLDHKFYGVIPVIKLNHELRMVGDIPDSPHDFLAVILKV